MESSTPLFTPRAPLAAMPRRDRLVAGIGLPTILGGILLDTQGPAWGQVVVDAWTWLFFAWMIGWGVSTARERVELVSCMALAWLAELTFVFVWQIYCYRIGNLPLFVPPGHAVVFATGVRISRILPGRLLATLLVPVAGWTLFATLRGIDTHGGLLSLVFVAFLIFGGERRRLFATMFLFTLSLEIFGARLGCWHYAPVVPYLGTTSTNPPAGMGVWYCLLDLLVLTVGAAASRAVPALRRPQDAVG